jgi:signal transduction histidine kinase
MVFRWVLLLCTLFSGLYSVHSQSRLENEFDSISETIKHSTYFDSTAVFENGERAILIAKELGDLSKEALIYQYYGSYNYHSGKMILAKSYYDSSIVLATAAKDTSLLISSKIRNAFILSTKDSYRAEKEFKRLLNLSSDYKNKLECLNGLALISENRNENAEALGFYLKALQQADSINDGYFKGLLMNNIGLIKLKNQQFDEALSDFEQALEYAKEVDEIRLTYNLQNNIGLIFYSKKDYPAATEHYLQTLQHAKKIGFPYAIAVAHLNLSNALHFTDQFELALKYADSSLIYMKNAGEYENYSLIQFLRAQANKGLNNGKDALAAVEEGINYALENNDLEKISQGYNLQSEIYESLGQYTNAFNALKAHQKFKDSLDEISNKGKIAELQIAYKAEKKERELEEEKNKTKLLKSEKRLIQREKQLTESRIVTILIISVVAVIGVIIFLYMRNLKLSKLQQKKFSQDLIETLDEERKRISADLHDDIGQSLSFAKSQSQRLKRGDDVDLEDIISSLSEVIDQTRNISHRLHPSYLEKIGLKRSIASLLEKVEAQTGIITSYELEEGIEQLGPEPKTQIYRITQECINNTLKHANAKSIRIMIETSDDGFRYSFQDSGSGMELKNVKNTGLGLMTIQERAHKINARLSIVSYPGKGFKLVMNIP